MPKLSGAEWLLLCVPPALLAGWAIVLRPRPVVKPVPPTKFALTIKEIKREKTQPFDARTGFDTKVTIILSHIGPTPKWWTDQTGRWDTPYLALVDEHGKQYRSPVASPVKFGIGMPSYDHDTGNYTCYYLTSASQVPASAGQVTLRAALNVNKMRPLWIVAEVRHKGEVVRLPPVPKATLQTVKTVEITPLTASDPEAMPGYNIQVKLTLQYNGPGPISRNIQSWGTTDGPRVVDRHDKWVGDGGIVSETESQSKISRQKTFIFKVPLAKIPRSAGPLFLKLQSSVNGARPLPIRIAVRDANGHLLQHGGMFK